MRAKCIFVWAILLLVLLGLTDSCSTTSSPPGSSKTTVSLPLLASPNRIEDIAAGQGLSYWGIIPGVSHKIDVLAQWGEPNVVRQYEDYESLHYFIRLHEYESPEEEYFLVKDDIVQAITSTDTRAWLLYEGRAAKLEDLAEFLGEAEVVTPVVGPPEQIRVFPGYGLAVSRVMGSAVGEGDIHIYRFFVPTSLQEYQKLWGQYPLGVDPFPLIPNVASVGIRPGRTTQDQVRQLLGVPDRISPGDDGASWWTYYVEPDLQGRLSLYFLSSGILNDMNITNPALYVNQEEVVQRYGTPDAIRLSPDFEGRKYFAQSFLYLRRGLEVISVCPTSACDIVKRDTRVAWKEYTVPTTLEEYRNKYPESAFIEWHGFDQ
jgi:hypothetical protein